MPLEVTDAGRATIEQPVQELIHSVAAESDLYADGHALTELEVCDGLSCLADDGLLAGDAARSPDNGVNDLGVVSCLAAAHVDDDFIELRDLHDALVAELLHQSRSDVFVTFL